MTAATLLSILASAYGAGAYNTSTYNNSGSTLTNTGIYVIGIVTFAAVLLLIAMVVRIWKRPNKKTDGASDGTSQ